MRRDSPCTDRVLFLEEAQELLADEVGKAAASRDAA